MRRWSSLRCSWPRLVGIVYWRAVPIVIVGHGRRQLAWFAVTRHPTAEWLAQQIIEAFPWETALTYLVRDNNGAYGLVFRRRVQAMGDPHHGAIVSAVDIFLATRSGPPPSIVEEGSENPRPARVL
jgi:hypothetical protein